MNTHIEKNQQDNSKAISNNLPKASIDGESESHIAYHPAPVVQRNLEEMVNNSRQVSQLKSYQAMADNSSQARQLRSFQETVDNNTKITQQMSNQQIAKGDLAPLQFARKGKRELGERATFWYTDDGSQGPFRTEAEAVKAESQAQSLPNRASALVTDQQSTNDDVSANQQQQGASNGASATSITAVSNTTGSTSAQSPPDMDSMIDNALVASNYTITSSRVRARADGNFDRTLFCTVQFSSGQTQEIACNVHFYPRGPQGGSLWYNGTESKFKIPHAVYSTALVPTEEEKIEALRNRQGELARRAEANANSKE
jgi:hypothetical protein